MKYIGDYGCLACGRIDVRANTSSDPIQFAFSDCPDCGRVGLSDRVWYPADERLPTVRIQLRSLIDAGQLAPMLVHPIEAEAAQPLATNGWNLISYEP